MTESSPKVSPMVLKRPFVHSSLHMTALALTVTSAAWRGYNYSDA